MFLGGLDISSRPTIDWYRWFSLNRSSRNVSLTYHPLYAQPEGLSVTVLTARRRCTMPMGQSDGCLSTVWYQPRCVMVKTRPAQCDTDAGSVPRVCVHCARGEV